MEFRSVALLFALFALMTGRGFAQVSPSAPPDRTGEIRGTVEMPGVGGLAGVAVTLASAASSAEGDTTMAETRTDAGGAFAFTGVEPGRWVVSSRSDDGLAQARMVAVVRPGAVAQAVLRLEVRLSEEVTVTDARGARLKRETPASVGVGVARAPRGDAAVASERGDGSRARGVGERHRRGRVIRPRSASR